MSFYHVQNAAKFLFQNDSLTSDFIFVAVTARENEKFVDKRMNLIRIEGEHDRYTG